MNGCLGLFTCTLKTSHGFDATRAQIEAQEKDIPEYSKYLSTLALGGLEPQDVIFCGAGDSLACAIFVERLMNLEPRALDPYDLVLYPEVLHGRKKAYFISVSGRTKSNIFAAKVAKKKGVSTIAITANAESELARSCSDVIELKFTRTESLTPGTNSFTASLMAVSSLFKIPPKMDLGKMMTQARDWAKKNSNGDGAYHFVGSGAFYGIAMYGSAKISEFAGGQSSYQLTEEFSHINLFSMKRKRKNGDRVLILRYGKEDQKANELDASLVAAGVDSVLLPIQEPREHVVNRAISYSIHLQYLALEVALRRGLKRPSFLVDEGLLRVSDRMIY